MASRSLPPAAEFVSIDRTLEDGANGALERVRTAYGYRIDSVIHFAA